MIRPRLAITALVISIAVALGALAYSRGALDGVFGNETRRVLAATVTSLQAENKLVVYQYAGDTRVSIERSRFFGLVSGTQELFVPATVSYYLDMGALGSGQVDFDRQSNEVRVKLPKLKIGDVAFQPERATAINGGLLTMSDAIVQELQKANYAQARQAFVTQAGQRALVDLAKAQAIKNIKNYFEIPLRAVGNKDVVVQVSFADDGTP